jgi:hypothetical protein
MPSIRFFSMAVQGQDRLTTVDPDERTLSGRPPRRRENHALESKLKGTQPRNLRQATKARTLPR